MFLVQRIFQLPIPLLVLFAMAVMTIVPRVDAAPATEPVVFTEEANDTRVHLLFDGKFEVHLKEETSPETGWRVADLDGQFLELVGERRVLPSEKKEKGAAATRVFMFKTLARGTTLLELTYSGVGGESRSQKSYVLNIVVH